MKPVTAVDLDGTLAQYNGWTGDPTDIGLPVPLMLARVIRWLDEGKEVKIFTARANFENTDYPKKKQKEVIKAIEDWSEKYIGKVLPITYKKDHSLVEIWDDRAVQVIPNTGEKVFNLDGQLLAEDIDFLHCSNHRYFSTGCSDCSTAALFSSYVRNERLEKAARVHIHELAITPEQPSPKLQLIKNQLTRKIFIFLVNAASDAATALRKQALGKASKEEKAAVVAWAAIQWQELVDQVYSDLYETVKAAGLEAEAQLNIEVKEVIEKIAEEYAKKRTVDMVGEGTRYSLADSTKDDLESTIENAVKNNTSGIDIASDLKETPIFSKSRAGLIADTEVTMAQVYGHLEIWKRSGKVKSVNVLLSSDHVVEDSCDDVSEKSPWLIHEVPELPIHPNCKCKIEAHELT